ncbi:MAG: hypothetical protein ACLS4Z_06860 [Christensenellaceae bacterium]
MSSVLIGLQIGVIYTDHTWKHWYPDYEKEDISAVLEKETLDEADYALLYAQTGLTKIGVDGLLQENPASGKAKMLKIQDFYFKKHTVSCDRFNPILTPKRSRRTLRSGIWRTGISSSRRPRTFRGFGWGMPP